MKIKNSHATILFFIGPMIFMSSYLLLSRWPFRWFTEITDYIGFGVSLIIGLIGLINLSVPLITKFLIAVLYIPLLGIIIFYGSFMFVCAFFGDCL